MNGHTERGEGIDIDVHGGDGGGDGVEHPPDEVCNTNTILRFGTGIDLCESMNRHLKVSLISTTGGGRVIKTRVKVRKCIVNWMNRYHTIW